MSGLNSVAERIREWAKAVVSKSNADTLWQIPLTYDGKSPYGVGISSKMLQETLGITAANVSKHRRLADNVLEKMVGEGIIVPGHEAAALNKRRMLLAWFKSLNDDEKKVLPLFGNSLSTKRAFKGELKTLRSALGHYEIVREALDEINQELMDLGVLDLNYKSVKERGRDSRSTLWTPRAKKVTQASRYQALSEQPLNTVDDLLSPSDSRPFIQIEQLFAAASNAVASDSGKGNFYNASESLKKFYKAQYGDTKRLLKELLDEFTISRYKKWLEEQVISKIVSPSHGSTLISAVRKMLNRARQIEGLDFSEFFDVTGFESYRVTEQNKPFSMVERSAINDAIQKDIANTKRLLEPYEFSGCGENPINEEGAVIPGKGTLENARWLFENALEQKVVTFGEFDNSSSVSHAEKGLLSIFSKQDKGIHELYENWGLLTRVDLKILTPFILRLAQVTGMNLEPLLTLDIDDLVLNHEATGRPCLRYWKERSDGEKEYHLDLFHADLKWLTTKQSKEVSAIFDDVQKLTHGIRDKVEPKYSQRLFIYQSSGQRAYGKVRPVLIPTAKGRSVVISSAINSFAKRHNLKDESGEVLGTNISRFRPTFVSELIDRGVSLREIQLMLGHSSIQTTINYLDRMDFNSVSRSKVKEALKNIHKNVFTNHDKHEVSAPMSSDDEDRLIFKTPLSACKNIFDPPEFVRSLKSYTPGTPCSQYNKCLSCDNVIITAAHLPEIFAMERDYILLIERSRIMDTPYGRVVAENLELINEIVNPDSTDFSLAELEQGKRLAEYVETTLLVDGVSA